MGVTAEAIRTLIEPPLTSSGLELWDVEVGRDVVRVLVDRPGGIDLDALAGIAGQVVSPLLDEHPEVTPEGRFELEVSSPGVERTLRRPDHYARYLGTEVSVKTTVPVEGARRHHGVLVASDDHGIIIEPKDSPAGTRLRLDFDQIERARTVLVWGPSPKPGKGAGGAGKTGGAGPKKGQAVKRPAADGRPSAAAEPVASIETKDS